MLWPASTLDNYTLLAYTPFADLTSQSVIHFPPEFSMWFAGWLRYGSTRMWWIAFAYLNCSDIILDEI